MHTTVGSPYWMAPEVIRGSYDNLADVWSLGVTCIEMAEQGPPRGEDNFLKVVRTIPSSPPPTLKEPGKWSKEFQDFLSKCLQMEASNRSSCKELLKHPFVKGAKKFYKSELKALVSNTIVTVTTVKREKLKKKMSANEEQTKRNETIKSFISDQFISLNAGRKSVTTFSNVEGYPLTEDPSNMVTNGEEKTETVLSNDTNPEEGNQNDALGVDTVIIKQDNQTGTVIIQD